MLRTRRTRLLVLTLGLVAAATMAGTVSANEDDVIRTGQCTGSSDWKLKLSPEDGRIEVEFEVDSNVVGQVWNVRMKQNGEVFLQRQKTTQAPSGSFEVRRLRPNTTGTDAFVGRAVNPSTGEVCRGTASF